MRLALHWQILIGMLAGAVIGIAISSQSTERTTEITGDDTPAGYSQLTFKDSMDRIEIKLQKDSGDTQTYIVDGTSSEEGAYPTLKELGNDHKTPVELFNQYGRSTARWVGDNANKIGGLFLRLLKMVSVPLIIASLMTGVLGLGQASSLGRMFGRTISYYLATSLLAITVGLIMVNVIRPGLNSDLAASSSKPPAVSGNLSKVLFQQVETLIPTNPVGAVANSNFLSIISFSLAFSIFALLIGGSTLTVIRDLAKASFEVMMAMTMAIIKLAPIGVAFLMLGVTSTQGVAVFSTLAWYMITVLCALFVHAVIILPLILKFVAKRNPAQYAKAMSPALMTAFSSASSNGTLPLTLASVEERAGVNNRVSSFVLPLGATINMDGTALYEAVAVLFIAQLEFGANMELTDQIIVAFTALLASVGAAGIPHAGLVMMLIILQTVDLPVERQGLIIAVDRVLDMCRTSVNVWSDSCGCAVVARFEGDADDQPTDPLVD